MSLSIIKDDKKVTKNDKGEYEFKHTLVQALGQSNVNSIVDSYKSDRDHAQGFLDKYDDIMKDFKGRAKKGLEDERDKAEEFIKGITDENRIKVALELLDKTIQVKQELIDNFDIYLDDQYKTAETWMEKQKIDAKKKLDDADATLKFWSKYYEEVGEDK